MAAKRSETHAPSAKARRRIGFTITLQMDEAITELLATGFYGFSRTDVARRLLASALLAERSKNW